MATRIRDGVPGKEKTLPRQANPEQRRMSASPSASPSRPTGPTSRSTSSDKNVPNYLKPTRSGTSVNQPTQSAAVRKPASASAAASSDKPSLPGRRLANKIPVSGSQSSRALQSPIAKEKALRTSSSFSGSRSTGTTTQKGASNRILKTTAPKDVVKKPTLYTRTPTLKKKKPTIKRSGESSAEASVSSSVISSPERLHAPEIFDGPHPQEDDRHSYVTDEEPLTNASSSHITNEQDSVDALRNNEVTDDVVKDEEEQHTETSVQTKPDIHEQEDINIIESPTSEADNQDAAVDSIKTKEANLQNTQWDAAVDSIKTKEANLQNTQWEETSNVHLESQQVQEQLEDDSTHPVNENLEVKAEDQGEEEVKDATEAIKMKEEVKEEDQVVNLTETAEVEHIASPEPEPEPEPEPAPAPEQEPTPAPALAPATAPAPASAPSPAPAPAPAPEENKTVTPKHATTVQWKKESSAVSNDTIEETASKLREQRKNRVRALAGAFESRHRSSEELYTFATQGTQKTSQFECEKIHQAGEDAGSK